MAAVSVLLEVLLVAAWVAASAGSLLAAEQVLAEIACVPKGGKLDLECRLTLLEGSGRKPVTDQTVVVTADMPSMPGMHAVHPARAQPASDAGIYTVRLRLDMAGRWAVKIRIGEPVRGEAVAVLHVK
jgi:hypothetical protein